MSFTPGTPPGNTELSSYLEDLEQRIYEAFQSGEFERINLQKLYSIDKINNGDIINADGSSLDPGEGSGIYHYDEGYTKL